MQINNEGLDLIKRFEGLRLRAYQCPAGKWTIGYGHTGTEVQPNQRISVTVAGRLLQDDLRRFEEAVTKAVKVPLSANAFSALVSLAYNIGIVAFADSMLLRRLNAGDTVGAAEQFDRWTNAGRRVLPKLVRRRRAEKALFLCPDGHSP